MRRHLAWLLLYVGTKRFRALGFRTLYSLLGFRFPQWGKMRFRTSIEWCTFTYFIHDESTKKEVDRKKWFWFIWDSVQMQTKTRVSFPMIRKDIAFLNSTNWIVYAVCIEKRTEKTRVHSISRSYSTGGRTSFILVGCSCSMLHPTSHVTDELLFIAFHFLWSFFFIFFAFFVTSIQLQHHMVSIEKSCKITKQLCMQRSLNGSVKIWNRYMQSIK